MTSPAAPTAVDVAELEQYRGGRIYAIDAAETERLREQYTKLKSFHRPATAANGLVARVRFSIIRRREVTSADAERWLVDSLAAYRPFVDDEAVLGKVRCGTVWFVSDAPAPDEDVWSGECLFDEDDELPPVAFLYTETLANHFPGRTFDLVWQGAMDHFVGHLYPYHRGTAAPTEYDEWVACRNQHLAAQVRSRSRPSFRLVTLLLPPIYRVHKGIPLRNYRRLSRSSGNP